MRLWHPHLTAVSTLPNDDTLALLSEGQCVSVCLSGCRPAGLICSPFALWPFGMKLVASFKLNRHQGVETQCGNIYTKHQATSVGQQDFFFSKMV